MDGWNSPIILPPCQMKLAISADLWAGGGLEGNEIVNLRVACSIQGQISPGHHCKGQGQLPLSRLSCGLATALFHRLHKLHFPVPEACSLIGRMLIN